jgi:hypothetical protein
MRIQLIFLCIFVLFPYITISAQDTTLVKKPKAEFSGFFRFDYWFDSRQNVDGLDGLLVLYPKPPELDANGEDINAAPSLNGLAMGTRLRSTIEMPKIFNAKSKVFVEVDFTGTNNTQVHFRFRHGYTRLTWDSGTELDVGLTWHPMFVTEVFPYVAALNTGSPFQSFNRSPQITVKQNLTSSLKVILSALTQSDYKGYGPDGYSSIYLRNGVVPNLHAQLQLNVNSITAGIAVDFKSLKPKLYTTSLIDSVSKYITKERVNSLTSMAYLKIQGRMLTAKFKGMYGQNMGDHLMFGGYTISRIDSLTGNEKYISLNHIFLHANITYGKKVMPGIFVGYAKNLGASDNVVGNILYGRGYDVDFAFRVAPSFTYRKENLSIMTELEYTLAATGINDNTNKAKIIDAKNASNIRALIMIQYDF